MQKPHDAMKQLNKRTGRTQEEQDFEPGQQNGRNAEGAKLGGFIET